MTIFLKSISMVCALCLLLLESRLAHLVCLPSNAPPSEFRLFLVALRIKDVNGDLETFLSWDGSVLNIILAFNPFKGTMFRPFQTVS